MLQWVCLQNISHAADHRSGRTIVFCDLIQWFHACWSLIELKFHAYRLVVFTHLPPTHSETQVFNLVTALPIPVLNEISQILRDERRAATRAIVVCSITSLLQHIASHHILLSNPRGTIQQEPRVRLEVTGGCPRTISTFRPPQRDMTDDALIQSKVRRTCLVSD